MGSPFDWVQQGRWLNVKPHVEFSKDKAHVAGGLVAKL